jgi:hypothetical protein
MDPEKYCLVRVTKEIFNSKGLAPLPEVLEALEKKKSSLSIDSSNKIVGFM